MLLSVDDVPPYKATLVADIHVLTGVGVTCRQNETSDMNPDGKCCSFLSFTLECRMVFTEF